MKTHDSAQQILSVWEDFEKSCPSDIVAGLLTIAWAVRETGLKGVRAHGGIVEAMGGGDDPGRVVEGGKVIEAPTTPGDHINPLAPPPRGDQLGGEPLDPPSDAQPSKAGNGPGDLGALFGTKKEETDA